MRRAWRQILILSAVVISTASGISSEVFSGYDITKPNGFHIRSADDAFRLNLGGYTQVR